MNLRIIYENLDTYLNVNMFLYTFLLMLPFPVAYSWVERLRRLALNRTIKSCLPNVIDQFSLIPPSRFNFLPSFHFAKASQ